MNYFLFTSKYTDLHYEESKKYISQQYKNGDLVKVSFNDENYADYMRDSGGMEIIKETVVFVFGEDGYYYRLFKDHTEKGEKYPPGMPKRVIKQTLRLVKQVRANKKYQKNLVRRFKSKTVAKLGGAAGFRRYIYLTEQTPCHSDLKKPVKKIARLSSISAARGRSGAIILNPCLNFSSPPAAIAFLRKNVISLFRSICASAIIILSLS